MIENNQIKSPPKGLAILTMLGPSLVWAAEFIGSGEVILSTRVGAILGPGVLWAIVSGIFLKYWIGMSGARYTVCTGEGMIDMFSRMPGPKNWAVWLVLVAQLISATISIGSLASAGGVFINSLVPITPYFGGWFVTIFAFASAWSGGFNVIKYIMSTFVVVILVGVIYVSVLVFPPFGEILKGLFFSIPKVPEWALAVDGINENPWREILPLLGWAAGGFASQVWYSYWIMGAGYGATAGRGYGKPADEVSLAKMSSAVAKKIKGWCYVVYYDATVAMVLGIFITSAFLLAGSGVLGVNKLAPEGPDVALTLSKIFSQTWGSFGGLLFLIAGACALVGTQTGQMAGWPRLLADTFRICIPGFNKKFKWITQFRIFLVFFFLSNMIIVFTLGYKPVFLVKIGAILDGLLLTPLQAIWIAIGLYFVMPKMLSKEANEILKPHWIFAAILLVAFFVFGYFCVFQLPFLF
jgi:Mn2+/Fe2+ NRAMP family transporter